MRAICLLAILLIFASCKLKDCTTSFKTDYANLQTLFEALYTTSSGESDLDSFKTAVDSFYSSYKDVECKWDGGEYKPTSEVKKMKDDLDSSKVAKTYVAMKIAKVIYGSDDRLDLADITDADHLTWAKAVSAQIPNAKIDASFILDPETIGDDMNLCMSEPFRDQINPAVCSGFLVGADILVTAGHCITSLSACGSYKFVFNFHDNVTQVTADDVYTCTEIISREYSGDGTDYTIVRLDRRVKNTMPVKIRKSDKVADAENLVMIGHPSGLPVKIADGAYVRDNTTDEFFVANTDSYGGNSGSAVFGVTTGRVEGILVRGETDYVFNVELSCNESKVCGMEDCRGEDVVRITELADFPGKTVPSMSSLFDDMFDDKSLTKYSDFSFVPGYGMESAGYFLMGREFFNWCGLELFKNDSELRIDVASTSCDTTSNLQTLYDDFVNYVL